MSDRKWKCGCNPVNWPRCINCPAPPAEALDFEAAEKVVHERRLADGILFGRGNAESFETFVEWNKDALNTQHREALARARREVLEEVKAKFDQRPLLTTIDILGWLDTQLREGQ